MKPHRPLLGVLLSFSLVLGCGGGSKSQNQSQTDFSLTAAPSAITMVPRGPIQAVTVIASAVNGFTGNITVTVGPLPAGVTATPSTLSLPAGSQAHISISTSSSAAPGTASVALSGTSGTLTHKASVSLTIASSVTTASLSTSAFDFGNNLVNNTLTRTVVTVTNTGSATLTMSPALTPDSDSSYSIASGASCSQQLAAGAVCDMALNYTPKAASAPATQNATLNMGFGGVAVGTPQTVAITGRAAALPVGQVTTTNNPQVALYTMILPFSGSVTINFGPNTNYGLKTWTQSTATAGAEVSIFVAGMKATTTYHLRATVEFSNGIVASDIDHTFTTKASPANMRLNASTTTAAGMTPQPGLELLNPLAGTPSGVIVSDLSGNVLWTYSDPGNPALNFINGVKMLPDGNFLMAIGNGIPFTEPIPPGTINEIREVNLAGDTVREISIDDLNSKLAAANCAECQVTLNTLHHDVEPLPNGHWLVLADTTMALSNTSTPRLTNAPPATMLGDVVVDLDQNMQPVWVWNEFNHLDPNRHPMGLQDWTHTNAILYSKDDGNILVSIRHQNWIVKVKYADGMGDGSILWRLGEGGDITLQGGTDPTDWEYAQHGPSFFSANTSGVFSLGAMDNGNDRVFSQRVACGSSGAPPCLYSTIPIWQIEEGAKTAALIFHQILPPNLYSNFGGNVEQLSNSNVEYDLCSVGLGSYIYEVTQESSPQTVWSMHVTGTFIYRGFRIPSFYPGVQW
jgi:arylsulfate sulfotransferase